MFKKSFPFQLQFDEMDCGPTCLSMIFRYYGKHIPMSKIREKAHFSRDGTNMLNMSNLAEALGMKTLAVRVTIEQLINDLPLPCIAHYNLNHFIIIYKITENRVFVADPAFGLIDYSKEEFLKSWVSLPGEQGILLLLEPSLNFHDDDDEVTSSKNVKKGFGRIFLYLSKYRRFVIQLIIGLLAGTLISLILPFLTQAMVDYGINYRNLQFIYLILIAQLMMTMGRVFINFIRSWILLHISTRIGISLISDFLSKLMRLPISYFDVRKTGDILQRINDNYTIQNFLTSSSIDTLFSTINFFVFGIVLAIYNLKIFAVFIIGSILYVTWILFFLKVRKEINYKTFAGNSENQSNIIQLVTGMQEIKLNNCEKQKASEWEHIQARLFKIKIKGLKVGQYQASGSTLINEVQNIVISIITANEVIQGNMTLGTMMAVSYIVGQLNLPIGQLIGFVQTAQDAKISLDRLSEIYDQDEEENPEINIDNILPEKPDLIFKDVSFSYDGTEAREVLKKITVTIPCNKVTAIVGTSGSGKTTLLKLMLKFYKPQKGTVHIGATNMEHLSSKFWRSRCGTVMQEGVIFSDTVAKNIALSDEVINREKLIRAANTANIREFIETLPMAYNQKIGMEGHGLSMGQKQRFLIARAVYKNPEFLFFDEATNALDANNEKVIMDNLNEFFKGRTVVVVAHRLSTVKNADQILVLERGELVEQGNHDSLIALKGNYYNLVKNQLELGQ